MLPVLLPGRWQEPGRSGDHDGGEHACPRGVEVASIGEVFLGKFWCGAEVQDVAASTFYCMVHHSRDIVVSHFGHVEYHGEYAFGGAEVEDSGKGF